MSRFKSSKSIVNWLDQRKVVMFNDGWFTFFYKMIKGRLHVYNRFYRRWVFCHYLDINSFFLDMNNWYKSKHSEIKWI